MTPGQLIKQFVDATEPTVAKFIGPFSSTPAAIMAMMEADRFTRQLMARSEKLRSEVVHFLALPSDHDIKAIAMELDRIKGSLAEIEARFEDLER